MQKSPFMFISVAQNPVKTEKDSFSNEDAVTSYLNSISQYKLLSAEEEKLLAKRVKNGDVEAKKAIGQVKFKVGSEYCQKIQNFTSFFFRFNTRSKLRSDDCS